jgi:hypothetical protein
MNKAVLYCVFIPVQSLTHFSPGLTKETNLLNRGTVLVIFIFSTIRVKNPEKRADRSGRSGVPLLDSGTP